MDHRRLARRRRRHALPARLLTALLSDRVVIVTGAARGIGRGVARAVAEAGADVVVADLDLAGAEDTAARVESAGRVAVAIELDVTDESRVSAAIADTAERFGRLDGLVNNAGVIRMGAALGADEDDWIAQFDVNARALFACCRAAAGTMIDLGTPGAIVNISSNAGKVGYPNMAIYNASKAAVISLTRSLAAEWAPHGINVNAICPGGVESPMLGEVAEWIAAREGIDARALLDGMHPAQLGRHVRPIEVGRVVAFLLSDHAAIIRGQAINVDGGDTPY